MIAIKGSKGLGDAIYVRAAALHLLEQGEEVTVYTLWPDVFSDLPVTLDRPAKDGSVPDGTRFVAYSMGRDNEEGISNFEACCRKAGIDEPVPLRLDWTATNHQLVDSVQRKAAGRPIFIYQTLKRPRNVEQEALRPSRDVYNRYVAKHADYFKVRLGHPPFVDEDALAPFDLDLFGKATIRDAFDVGTVADFFFGESCYIPMLGEALGKRFAVMFTRRALNYPSRIRNMTPERLFHRKDLGVAVYDES